MGELGPGQPDRDLAEVDLGFSTRQVLLRDESVRGLPAGFNADLTASDCDVFANHPVRRQPGSVVLVQESVEDPFGGVPLLPRGVRVIT